MTLFRTVDGVGYRTEPPNHGCRRDVKMVVVRSWFEPWSWGKYGDVVGLCALNMAVTMHTLTPVSLTISQVIDSVVQKYELYIPLSSLSSRARFHRLPATASNTHAQKTMPLVCPFFMTLWFLIKNIQMNESPKIPTPAANIRACPYPYAS